MDAKTIEFIELLKDQIDTVFKITKMHGEQIKNLNERMNCLHEIIKLQQEEIEKLDEKKKNKKGESK